jgi:hypothetical protein
VNGIRRTRETRLETQRVVADLQAARRGRADVEDDLPVAHELAGNLDALHGGVDDDVGGVAAVHDPGVHGPEEVGTLR